jgi:hypothetical protein
MTIEDVRYRSMTFPHTQWFSRVCCGRDVAVSNVWWYPGVPTKPSRRGHATPKRSFLTPIVCISDAGRKLRVPRKKRMQMASKVDVEVFHARRIVLNERFQAWAMTSTLHLRAHRVRDKKPTTTVCMCSHKCHQCPRILRAFDSWPFGQLRKSRHSRTPGFMTCQGLGFPFEKGNRQMYIRMFVPSQFSVQSNFTFHFRRIKTDTYFGSSWVGNQWTSCMKTASCVCSISQISILRWLAQH